MINESIINILQMSSHSQSYFITHLGKLTQTENN